MQLKVTQENLSKALGMVARVANSRSTLPILSNVLLKTDGKRLSISATNLDIAITEFTGAKIATEGAITVPARLTQDFVSSLPEGVLNLEVVDHKLSITTEKYASTINGVVADEFPIMPSIEKPTIIKIDATSLKKGLQQTLLAASNDDSRPVLTGLYLHTHNGELYMVATDSYRLAEKKLGKQIQESKLLVPASALQELTRLLEDKSDVTVSYDDQQIRFELNSAYLTARLLEGSYPDYRKLIPASFQTVAKLSKSEFQNITKVSSLFARESAGSITLKINDNKVSITSVASQLGENTAEANAEVTGGGEVTLNSRYLADALNVMSGDEVEFCFNGKLEPCLLRDTADSEYNHVIMPLRT